MLSAAELEQLQAFLDQELPTESSAMIAEKLATDPAWAAALVTLSRETAIIADWGRVRARADRIQTTATKAPRSVRVPMLRRTWLARAATLIVVVSGMVFWMQSHSRSSQLIAVRLEQVSGHAFIVDADARRSANAGEVIHDGEGLEVDGADSSAVVLYADGTRVEIDGDAKISAFAGGAPGIEKRIHIATGSLRADVAKQSPDRPMKLITATAEIVVIGTRFDLTGGQDATYVETEEGAVRLIRKSDGHAIDVPAGFEGVARSGAATLDSQLSPPRLASSRFATPGHYRTTALSPDGQTLVTSRYNSGDVLLWNVAAGQLRTTLVGTAEAIVATAFSADGRHLATGGSGGTITVWDLSSGQMVNSLSGVGEIQALSFCGDGAKLAMLTGPAQQPKSLTLWNLTTQQRRSHAQVYPCEVWAFSPSGKTLATASTRTSSVTLWDVESGVETRVLHEFPQRVICLAISPSEAELVVSDMGGRVTLWSLDSGELAHTFRPPGDTVHGLAFSVDGQRLAMGQRRATVRLWNVTDRRPIAILAGSVASGSTATIRPIFFSADGATLATTESHDAGTVRLWTLPP